MASTVTYATILNDWANLCQLDPSNILNDDSETFRTSFNRHSRRVHNFMDWPETVNVEELTELTATNQFDPLDALNAEPEEVLSVYTKNPRTDQTAEPVQFDYDGEYIYLIDEADATSIFIRYIAAPTELASGGDTTTTIPKRFQYPILYSCVADWYGATDDAKHQKYKALAEEALMDEAELVERRMGKVTETNIRPYPHGGA